MAGKMTPQAFVAKWKPVTGKEISVAQSHFNDLCALVDYPTPIEADPTVTHYCFEAGVVKATGGLGRADVWKKGYFAWEYKGKHGDLDKAYDQLLRYKDSLENPPLLIVCGISEIRIHTNFTNSVKKVHTITLDDLLVPEMVGLLRRAFTDPESFRVAQTPAQVTAKAAARFAELAQLYVKWGHEPHAVAHFLIRIMFCFFAEDVDLLPSCLFTRLLGVAKGKPKNFRPQLAQLFQAMVTGGMFGSDEIRQFNGELFDNADVLDADSSALAIMAEASALDWANIQPSIFGTLFERSLDPTKRAQLGAHYTGEEDILLIVEPVLMAPLRRRWAEIQAQAHALAAERDAAGGARRTRLHNDLLALLRDFRHELAAIRVLDAACGAPRGALWIMPEPTRSERRVA
jgi:hypothetical protein